MTNGDLWQRVTLSNPEIELSLLPGIGGRLMNVTCQGEAILFENPDSVGFCPDLSDLSKVPTKAGHFSFPLWGGEKTWVAPERFWPAGGPHPDLDSGPYEWQVLSPSSVRMTSTVCSMSGLQIVRTVKLSEDAAGWTVLHELINRSQNDLFCGIWSVMMVRRPVSVRCRMQAEADPTVLMGNPNAAITRVSDKVEVTCNCADEFKIGIHPSEPLAEVCFPSKAGSLTMITEAASLSLPSFYAHGHALEIYNSGVYEYAEIEWHGPAKTLAPGDSSVFAISHLMTGTWS